MRSTAEPGKLEAMPLPDPKLGSQPVQFGSDITDTVIIATARRVAATEPDRTATVAIWNTSRRSWVEVTDDLPVGAVIASDGDGSTVQVDRNRDGTQFTFTAFS